MRYIISQIYPRATTNEPGTYAAMHDGCQNNSSADKEGLLYSKEQRQYQASFWILQTPVFSVHVALLVIYQQVLLYSGEIYSL